MNHVLLVGRLDQQLETRTESSDAEALLRLAVRRREPGGALEPGITSLEVVVPWPQSRQTEQLQVGDLVAISGLIEGSDFGARDGGTSEQRIVADWVERLRPRGNTR